MTPASRWCIKTLKSTGLKLSPGILINTLFCLLSVVIFIYNSNKIRKLKWYFPLPQLHKRTIVSAMNTSSGFESSVLPPLNELEWRVSQYERRCMSMVLMIQDSVYIGDQYFFYFFFFSRNHTCSEAAGTSHCCLSFPLSHNPPPILGKVCSAS